MWLLRKEATKYGERGHEGADDLRPHERKGRRFLLKKVPIAKRDVEKV
jgi:hypothetical protein